MTTAVPGLYLLFAWGATMTKEKTFNANDSGFRLFHRYAPQLDHALYYDADNLYVNTYVRPDVIRLTGGDIITPDDSLRGTFWLVQHFDFDIELQEDILQQFESRYQRLETYDFEGVRYFHY